MGIYIKGIDTPKNCGECDDMFLLSAIGCDCCVFGLNERPTDCPLTEVAEPSGDLISRADVLEGLKHSTAYLHDDIYEIVNRIPSAETTGALDDAIAKYVADGYMLTPSGELISRADAIEAIQNAYCKPCKERGDDHNEVRCRACEYDNAIIQIDALPSAEAEWIPCSEMLPKPWESVMTTICWVGDEYEDYYDIAVGFKKISGGWCLTLADGTEVIKGFLVQAWMPLPNPYKGGEE